MNEHIKRVSERIRMIRVKSIFFITLSNPLPRNTMTQYRYQLERYRGRSTRHVCPQCGRKNVFTRYIDTENNNIYISDNVGKCNRLDKCGYHYTPHQYFTDNPWKRENVCSFFLFHRKNERTNKNKTTPPRRGYIPEWVLQSSRRVYLCLIIDIIFPFISQKKRL